MLCHEQQRSITCKMRVDQTIPQPEGLGVAFIATGPGLGLVMYILTTLEFPKHNHDFHLDQTMSDLSPAWMRWEFICYHDSIFYSEQHNSIQFSFKGRTVSTFRPDNLGNASRQTEQLFSQNTAACRFYHEASRMLVI